MNLNEITQLIEIRSYVFNAINNFNLPKEEGHQLNKMLVLIDRRIVDRLMGEEFKNFLGYQDADKVMLEAAKNNNKPLMKPPTY
jgi:hypothetical protein